MKPADDFAKQLNLNFNDISLLTQALTHRSWINENRGQGRGHNERLEFLGDAVLELVSTRFLYDKFPEKPEGELTALRAALVNTMMLSDIAQSIGMNEYLLLSRGESKDTGRARQFLLANALEAVIGAIYLDQGYDAAKEFIEKNILPKIDEVIARRLWQDAKSAFQEKAQEVEGATPTYSVIRETGPDHDRHFVVGVHVRNALVAQGEGRSKQDAEQDAARKGLQLKGW